MSPLRVVFSLLGLALASTSSFAQALPTLAWQRILNTGKYDVATGVTVDSLGNSYVSGTTGGDLQGLNAGDEDAFVSKYGADGDLLWSRQFGTTGIDQARAVSVDTSNSVYVAGTINGALAGTYDAFLAKYDSSGNPLWTRHLETASIDVGEGVAVDGLGNAYVSGRTWGDLAQANAGQYDVFLAKYDPAGNLIWTQQFGDSTSESGYDVAVDDLGSAYVVGYTQGSLGAPSAGLYDAFLRRYDAAGNVVWNRQLGTTRFDWAQGVAVSKSGHVYIAGGTDGSLDGMNAGSDDAFVSKYDAGGNLLWCRQLGTTLSDGALGAATDVAGNVYITGRTAGSFGDDAAGDDAFLSKFTADGALLWTHQFGADGQDGAAGVAVALGRIYVSGVWNGGGRGESLEDGFVAKFTQIPEPGSVMLLAASVVGVGAIRRRP